MSDIRLFRIDTKPVAPLTGQSMAVEASLQDLIEAHLDAFLGIRFLATEYTTGKTHGGRIDTLGLDENHCPVIIEYKRALNENVINQGLFYLDWLMDHKGEFTLLVMKQLGKEASDVIEWSSPRLLCIAGDFTKYDEYAVQQINRNIELIRYRRYGNELLLLELVNATTTTQLAPAPGGSSPVVAKGSKPTEKSIVEKLASLKPAVRDRWGALRAFLLALGDDVQMKELKYYVAFKRIQNFACVEVAPQTGKLAVYVKCDPDRVHLEDGFTRDVRNIGHWGTGELEISISSDDDLERAKPLILRSYEGS